MGTSGKFQIGQTVFWIEPPTTIQQSTVIGFSGGRYIVTVKDGAIRLPESRFFSTYEEAVGTLPQKPDMSSGKGRWHWFLEDGNIKTQK